MDTDYERVVETIFKPVRCILKSVKIRAIRGQNSNESPCNFGVWAESSPEAQRLRAKTCGVAAQLSETVSDGR
jgi:hypothetical protein